jgi:hypothetical protein
MWFCTTDRFYSWGRQMIRPAGADWIPFDRQQMMDTFGFGWPDLPMTARQAYCSHLPEASLFRYFILADCDGSCDDWIGTHVTRVRGQVKILFSHEFLAP